MNLDDMSPEQIIAYVKSVGLQRELEDIAGSLHRDEEHAPGTILAILGMSRETQMDALWSRRSGTYATTPRLKDENGTIIIFDESDSTAWCRLTPTPDVPAAPLTPSGHCVVGTECSQCQYEAMTPDERAERDRESAESLARLATRPRRTRSGADADATTPAAPEEPELAEWERELLAEQLLSDQARGLLARKQDQAIAAHLAALPNVRRTPQDIAQALGRMRAEDHKGAAHYFGGDERYYIDMSQMDDYAAQLGLWLTNGDVLPPSWSDSPRLRTHEYPEISKIVTDVTKAAHWAVDGVPPTMTSR